ncbi:MAG: GerW family sporulation protein [Chitinophagales bacterium]
MEAQHPIEGLMRTTLESIKNMVDVNTILGDPVETPDGKVIVPISRVTFGFAAGGTEYELAEEDDGGKSKGGSSQGMSGGKDGGKDGGGDGGRSHPFGGGSGAGISIQPVGFLVVGRDEMRLLPVDSQVLYDRLLDLAPRLIDGLQGLLKARGATGEHAPATSSPVASSPVASPAPVAAPVATSPLRPLVRLRNRHDHRS